MNLEMTEEEKKVWLANVVYSKDWDWFYKTAKFYILFGIYIDNYSMLKEFEEEFIEDFKPYCKDSRKFYYDKINKLILSDSQLKGIEIFFDSRTKTYTDESEMDVKK